jgi:spermidine/putrescine transport system permease protein
VTLGPAVEGRPPARAHPKIRDGPSRLATTLLVLPAGLWYLFLLLLPIGIVILFSLGNRGETGGYAGGFTFANYEGAFRNPSPFVTSLYLSIAGTVACLLVGLPLAYFIATRAGRRKTLFIILLVVPFWTSFLIRTYSWLILLGRDGLAGWFVDVTGNQAFRILGTDAAVLLGLVYGYLPLMVFPLYVTLERMDRTLVDASKDLGAGRWATFRQVTLPIALPGLITGSILVFIPMMGEYVIPQILGYGQTFTIGNALVLRFLEFRDWPAGSAQAVGLIFVMFVTISFYLWFTNRGRQVREQSVL